jgi:GrpB-like predicted nucleotidyltransferase (UPF0157 family)
MFETEKKRIVDRLGEEVAEVHHVGSTAVPGLRAKPEIDILVVVKSLAAIDEIHSAMAELGYAVRGECGIPGRHHYSKDVGSVRTHKAHVCEPQHSTVHEQLAFRDYLRDDPEAARDYERLKIRLAEANIDGMVAYLDGKRPFIEGVIRQVMGEGASVERERPVEQIG